MNLGPLQPEPIAPAPSPDTPAPEQAAWLAALQSLTSTVIIAVFVITFLLQAFTIPSVSMEDTLLIGDYLLVDKLSYADSSFAGIIPYRPVQRGDIVVFLYPVNPAQHFVKRVMGIPGDRIRIERKRLFVNDVPLVEDYVRLKGIFPESYPDDFPQRDLIPAQVNANWWLQMPRFIQRGELVVPPGVYFVLGDNRDRSLDSRYWGFVPQQNILGQPLFIYWSVRNTEGDLTPAGTLGDKIYHFAFAVTHMSQVVRWDRTMRRVH
jgi:signal peptidase I